MQRRPGLSPSCETKGRRQRQDAEGLCLLPSRAGGTQIRARLRAAAHAEADARTRCVRRQVHVRLSRRISGELVRPRHAVRRAARSAPQLLRRERLAVAGRVASEGLDPPAGSARMVSVVLPVLHGPEDAGRREADSAVASHRAARRGHRETLSWSSQEGGPVVLRWKATRRIEVN